MKATVKLVLETTRPVIIVATNAITWIKITGYASDFGRL